MVEKKPDITVFIIHRESKCSECDEILVKGSWITLVGEGEDRDAVCLECSDLDHLVFLERGDAALTRRAGKYSKLRAVVLEWAHRRNHYERQGTMVEAAALERAEEEGLADADLRAARAERRRESEAVKDVHYIERFRDTVLSLYPSAPPDEALAVRAAIRHQHTPYDELLMDGQARLDARREIAPILDAVEAQWMKK